MAPMIKESPVCIACEVVRIEELGSHDMFIANVKGVYADEAYMDEKGKFDLIKAKPIVIFTRAILRIRTLHRQVWLFCAENPAKSRKPQCIKQRPIIKKHD